MRFFLLFLLAGLLSGVPIAAQQPSTGAPCEDAGSLLTASERQYCFALAQAVEAAQPQLGILVARGNPTVGTAAIQGLRLGTLPPLSASIQISAVQAMLPDVRRRQTASTARLRVVAPALAGSVAVGIFPGFQLSPRAAGLASVDLLASAAWLPFNLVEVRGLASEASEFAFGAGARVGLLRETFGVPAISASLMYHRLGRVQYGDVCPAQAGADLLTGAGRGYDLTAGICAAPGDDGEFATDASNWSGRATVSKRLAAFGVAGGVGYDRFRSTTEFGLGASPNLPLIGVQPVYVRGSNLVVEQSRWSAFANASYTLVITTLAAEAGWMQGGAAVAGFDAAASQFDPRRGTLFGSLGARITF